MRPDPHKKKYTGAKKKDGRKGGDKAKKASEDRHKDTASSSGSSSRAGGACGSSENMWKTDTNRANITAPSVAAELEEFTEKKSFSRRKLESNWDRYEDVHYVDDIEPVDPLRGEDFQVLLKQAGDALTQFRFQDEEDWETEASEPDIMALDCQDLASAIRCVPLHVRLGIEDMVPAELASQYEEEASLYRSSYKPADRTRHADTEQTDLLIESSICDDVIDDHYHLCDGLEDEKNQIPYKRKEKKTKDSETFEQVNNAQKEYEAVSPVENTGMEKFDDCDKTVVDKQNVNSDVKVSDSVGDKCKTDPGSVDEQLDFLLSLETPKTSDVTCDVKPPTEKPVLQVENVEERTKPTEHTKKKEEDLENWLDSVLDD